MQAPAYVPSYYAATAHPTPLRPALAGAIETDVCVVGAGLTGIATALELAERGYRVVVVEAERVGWGASGRNGGQIVNGYNLDLVSLRRRFGASSAAALAATALEGGRALRERVRRHGIACELKDGALLAALTPQHLRRLERRKHAWEARGRDGLELLVGDQLQHWVRSPRYVGGLLDRHGGHVHPLNLVLGEAAALEAAGGQILEGSRALRIEPGPRATVRTATGTVTAAFAAVCGNAYLGRELPFLRRRFLPIASQMLATAPLDPATAQAILPGDVAVEDCNFILSYYRLSGDRRLLFGGGVVHGGTDRTAILRKLRPLLARTFPALADVAIEHTWSGEFALTLSGMPHLGRLGGNVYFAYGCNGYGLTLTHLMGRFVGEAIAGQAERFDLLARLPTLPIPGGQMLHRPLTYLGTWYYRLRDALGV